MAGRASKAKGYRGEIEVKEILEGIVSEVYGRAGIAPPELSRSPHGRDLVGLPWIAVEVKRVERDNPFMLSSWWNQAKEQAGLNREPVLFYRMNSRPWNIRMFGYLAGTGTSRIRCPVDIGLEAFSAWFRIRLEDGLNLKS